MADVSVRPARPQDAERIARVQLETWRAAYADVLPPDALALPEEQVAAVWLHAVEAPAHRQRVLVALERDDLVGFLASTPAQDEDLDPVRTTEVTALLVLPGSGRRGHGSRLLAAAVQDWQADGVETAVAWTWDVDAASRSFLQAAGWEGDGLVRGLEAGTQVQRQLRLHVDVRPAPEGGA